MAGRRVVREGAGQAPCLVGVQLGAHAGQDYLPTEEEGWRGQGGAGQGGLSGGSGRGQESAGLGPPRRPCPTPVSPCPGLGQLLEPQITPGTPQLHFAWGGVRAPARGDQHGSAPVLRSRGGSPVPSGAHLQGGALVSALGGKEATDAQGLPISPATAHSSIFFLSLPWLPGNSGSRKVQKICPPMLISSLCDRD